MEAGRPSLSRRVGGAARVPIILASFLFFLTTTAAFIISVYRTFQGLVLYKAGADAYPIGVIDGSVTAETVSFALALTIGDFMILYRLWAVWRTPSVIILPTLSIIGLFTGIAYRIISTAKFSKGLVSLSGERSTMVQLSLRAKSLYLRISQYFLAIFVESAAAHTAWTVIFTVLHLLDLNIQMAILFTVPSVLGCANALITCRVALGRAAEVHAEGSSATRNHSIRFAPARTGTGSAETHTVQEGELGQGIKMEDGGFPMGEAMRRLELQDDDVVVVFVAKSGVADTREGYGEGGSYMRTWAISVAVSSSSSPSARPSPSRYPHAVRPPDPPIVSYA
ncbi:hypothetical protein HMN09_01116200 [Mycena chlorophos]|uniref:Uncharacterized protein n=1 Tax=Mycena chlorophos TaxID=658473 RepID=A0A8H6VVQ4_MYCCL|nr:hypothetical protein HMN09_01116200 [Mycena chlorophos]